MEFFVKITESINDAINNANENDTIILDEGVYNEKIKISKSNITIIGQGKNKTIIANKDWSPKINIDNKEYNTFRTYTLMAAGDNITIKDLTIQNLSVPSKTYGQAVALHVIGDNFSLIDSSLLGAQDTLFCGPLPPNLQLKYKGFLKEDELTNKYSRQFYQNCYIEGDVDFIFGGGTAIFDKCHFHSINPEHGFFFAPSHNEDQKYGFTCFNCKFSGVGDNSMYLGRPWRDYGKVTLIDCEIIGNIIKSEGWNKWNNTNRDKTARFEEYNTNIDTSSFVSWSKHLNSIEAKSYTKEKIFK
ncbi:MAG: pectinesterase family protein [Anaeroplasmataceae bacterium]